MALRTHRLNVERLEGRELMAGNLSAFVSGGVLIVQEDPGSTNTSNGVQIFQLADGRFRVFGLAAADGSQTTVNGADFADLAAPSGLNVRLGAGDDLVVLHSAAPRAAQINVGAPNIADSDQVFVLNVRTQDSLSIFTGGGGDRLSVRESTIGDGVAVGSEGLFINTGAGADAVEVGSAEGFNLVRGRLSVKTFEAVTEPDADTVAVLGTHVAELMALDLGAGHDLLRVEFSSAGDIVALTGVGNDRATLTEVTADDQFFVDMSAGNDRLDIVFLRATDLALHGGTGRDRLTTFLDGSTVTKTITGFESINGPEPPFTFWIGVDIGDERAQLR